MTLAEDLPVLIDPEKSPQSRARPWLRWFRWLKVVRHLGLPIVLLILLLAGIRYVPIFRYEMNPDGCSYMNIAKQYLDGNFWDAVNAYWSPLISWLLIPFMAAGLDAPLATKILAVMVGGGIISASWWILRNAGATRDICFYVALALVPIVLYLGLPVTTPDSLMAMAVLIYLAQMTDPKYDEHTWSSLATGFLMGVAYLAKAYALSFIVGHFLVVNLIYFIRSSDNRKRIGIDVIAAILVLLVIAGTWGSILGSKYDGGFTLGSTGRYNLQYNGPHFRALHHTDGFLRLPNPTAISSWDDATYYDVPKWDPFGTPAEREKFRQNRLRNWNGIKKLTESFTWMAWPILFAGVLLAGSRNGDPAPRKPALILVLAIVLYPLGYYCLHVMERFLPPVCFLLLILAATCVAAASRAFKLGPVRRFAAMGLICLTFFHNAEYDPAKHDWTKRFARWALLDRPVVGAEAKPIADGLAGLMPAGSSFASNGPWKPTIYVSSWLDLRYHGTVARNWSAERIENELRERKIQYFWVWENAGTPPFVNSLPELTGGKVPNIRLYRLDWPTTTQPAR